MRKKKNNNLVCIQYDDGEILYFTSMNRAGRYVGLQYISVDWALKHGNTLVTDYGRKFIFRIVDGSDIPYKLIDNY